MDHKTELEELIAAAQRHEADQRRQQQLSEMVDQWAAAETPHRRHLWTTLGIAASIILLMAIGLRLLLPGNESSTNPPLTAQADMPTTAADTVEAHDDATNATPVFRMGTTVNRLASASTPDVIKKDTDQTSSETPEPLYQTDPLEMERPQMLLAEEATTTKQETHLIAMAQKRTHERTSTRLVCGTGCKPEQSRPTAPNVPQMAMVNNSGSATFEVGSIPF